MAARLLALAWLASSGHVGLDGPTYAPTSPNVLGCDDLCVGFRCATYSAQSCAVVLEDFGCACAGCACACALRAHHMLPHPASLRAALRSSAARTVLSRPMVASCRR